MSALSEFFGGRNCWALIWRMRKIRCHIFFCNFSLIIFRWFLWQYLTLSKSHHRNLILQNFIFIYKIGGNPDHACAMSFGFCISASSLLYPNQIFSVGYFLNICLCFCLKDEAIHYVTSYVYVYIMFTELLLTIFVTF